MKLEKTAYNGVYVYHGARGDVYYGSFWYSKKKTSTRVRLGSKKEGITSAKKAYAKLEEIRKAANSRTDLHYKTEEGETVFKLYGLTLEDIAERYFQGREKKIRHEFIRVYGEASTVSDSVMDSIIKKKLRAVKTERRRFDNYVKTHKISKMKLTKIQRSDVLEWLEYLDSFVLSKKIKNKTFLNIVNLLRTIWNKALKNGYIVDLPNPFMTLEIKNKNTRPIVRERYLTVSELDLFEETLRKKAEENFSNKNAYIAFMLGRYTGARVNTVLNIRVRDFDFSRDRISLFNFKANKFYDIPISSKLKKFVLELIREDDLTSDDYLIHPRRGVINKQKPLHNVPAFFYRVADELFNNEADALQRVNFHTLRHSFATRIAEISKSPYQVKEFLDHSDSKISERYVKRVGDTMKNIIDGV